MRLDDGQSDSDELAEELEDLLRGHHVLLPYDVLHPDPRGGLLARLEQLGDVPAHLAQLQLPPVPQQLYPRDRQLQQRLALGAAEAAAAAALAEEGVQHRHGARPGAIGARAAAAAAAATRFRSE